MEELNFIALFGPPGVGKSTIVNVAKDKGLQAFDCEVLGKSYGARSTQALRQFKKYKEGIVFVGAADLKPEDFPDGTLMVMILPEKEVYKERLRKRNELHPKKKKNGESKKYKEFAEISKDFDLVVGGEGTPIETINKIQKYIHEKELRGDDRLQKIQQLQDKRDQMKSDLINKSQYID